MSRTVLLALGAALLACGGPVSDIEGHWEGLLPGQIGLDMTLSESSGMVSGTGTYCIGGRCPTATLQVHGTFSDPAVTLLIDYEGGTRGTFDGTLETPSRIVGTYLFPGSGGQVPLTFSKLRF